MSEDVWKETFESFVWLIEKAVLHYSKGMNAEELDIIQVGLEFLQFGISNCLITFRDKHFRYDSSDDQKMRHLSIGGFDSAFYADRVACYLLDMSEDV